MTMVLSCTGELKSIRKHLSRCLQSFYLQSRCRSLPSRLIWQANLVFVAWLTADTDSGLSAENGAATGSDGHRGGNSTPRHGEIEIARKRFGTSRRKRECWKKSTDNNVEEPMLNHKIRKGKLSSRESRLCRGASGGKQSNEVSLFIFVQQRTRHFPTTTLVKLIITTTTAMKWMRAIGTMTRSRLREWW